MVLRAGSSGYSLRSRIPTPTTVDFRLRRHPRRTTTTRHNFGRLSADLAEIQIPPSDKISAFPWQISPKSDFTFLSQWKCGVRVSQGFQIPLEL